MNRAHAHHHHHNRPNYSRAFLFGVLLNVAFIVVEVVYGILSNSLALLTDAGHNLSDVLGLLLAWGAASLARRKPSPRRTYGYSRATILASLFSGLLLMGAVGAIAWEAVSRFMEPAAPIGKTIVIVAAIGVAINTATAMLFYRGKDTDLNIRGAFLHMAADAAVSLGVVISGVLIWIFGWHWIDPMTSLLIAAVIFLSTWGLLRDSLNLAVDAVPPGVDPVAIRAFLLDKRGVVDVHDLHIWALSTTDTALTAHLVMNAKPEDDCFLNEVSHELEQRFEVHHPTIQIEVQGGEELCPQIAGCAD
jgi:cobalt-zinc-cadmium efflux system protein